MALPQQTKSGGRDRLTIDLLDRIYAAAVDPPAWQLFARDLSHALGGSPVTVWVRMAGNIEPAESYRAGTDPRLQPILTKYYQRGLPWRPLQRTEGFELLDPDISREEIERTDFYREWMQPQGIAPASPMIYGFGLDGQRPLVGTVIYQLEGRPLFGPLDLAFVNRLIPHLERAFWVDDHLRALRRGQDILAEVMDRLPTGIMLLDADGSVVACNRAADISVENARGLDVHNGRPITHDRDENDQLQRLIREAIAPDSSPSIDSANALHVSRKAGGGRLPLLVSPLMAPRTDHDGIGAVAVILLADPTVASPTASIQILRTLYGLTRAEADLTQLLTQGLSLEAVAERRRVTLNTTRSQLKHVFAKTGAKRQSDLVRIVLSGIATLRAS